MIKVIKDGVEVKGWKSVSVRLSLSTVCDGFNLSQFVADDFSSPVLFPGQEYAHSDFVSVPLSPRQIFLDTG